MPRPTTAPAKPHVDAEPVVTAPGTAEHDARDKEMLQKWNRLLPHDRMVVADSMPFVGGLAMTMEMKAVVDYRVRTACTDGKTVFVNPYFFERLKEEERLFVFSHEVWHAALSHFLRRGTREPELFNVATDLEVNRLLMDECGKGAAKFKIPSRCLRGDEYFGKAWTEKGIDKMSAEQMYEIILEIRKQKDKKDGKGKGKGKGQGQGQGQGDGEGDGDANSQSSGGQGGGQGQGQPGQGQGSGKGQPGKGQGQDPGEGQGGAGAHRDASGRGGFADDHIWDEKAAKEAAEQAGKMGKEAAADKNHPYHGLVDKNGNVKTDSGFKPQPQNQTTRNEWNSRVLSEAQRQSSRGRGTQPGALGELIEALGTTKVPWKQILSRFMETTAVSEGHDYTRPRRRYLPMDIIMPDRREPKMTLNAAFDTSGSVSTEALRNFLGNIKSICEQFRNYEIRLYQCDAEVAQCTVYNQDNPFEPTKFEILGRGGTCFQPVFDAIALAERLSGQTDRTPLVYFTDGMGDNPEPPSYPVLWALVDSDECSAKFGQMLRIDKEDLKDDAA